MVINNKKAGMALTQIFLLIIGMFAFAYAFGGQVGFVSAEMGSVDLSQDTPTPSTTNTFTKEQKGADQQDTTTLTDSFGTFDANGGYVDLTNGGRYQLNEEGTWFNDINKDGIQDPDERDVMPDESKAATALLTKALDYGIEKYLKKQVVKKIVAKTLTYGGQLLANAGFALGLSVTISGVLQLFGIDPQLAQGIGSAVGSTYMTYTTITATFGTGGPLAGIPLAPWLANPWVAGPITLAVGLKLLRDAFAKEKVASVTFECKPWKPPVGGIDCDKCNDEEFGCSQYQCMSLGTQCKLINQGTSEQKCFWDNRNDIYPPIITAWKDILPMSYNYVPDASLAAPHEGVIIKFNETSDGCLPAFRIFAFGVALNKDGICRIDNVRTDKYGDMDPLGFAGNSMYRINHSQVIMFPDQVNVEQSGRIVPPGGEYSFFVRCEGANGVSNTAEFGFKFCVQDEDDISEPQIYDSDPPSGSPLAWFNETEEHEEEITLYINKPSECKWDHIDKDFEEMENSMTCATNVLDLNAEFTYPCTATLTGLENNQDNNFYFRCKDQPLAEDQNKRNVMKSSHPLTLVGTRALSLSDVEPENETTIKGPTGSVKVKLSAKTSAGYDLGKATCEYKEINENRYTQFENTDSYRHSSNIWLVEGDYEYYVRCYDLGGNFDKELISFSVESDTTAPIVVRAFHESSYLKIITNEDSTCVYSDSTNIGCDYSYDDGIAMNNIDETEHYTQWNTNVNYYIKCEDEFGNRPYPNQCSITIRPMEI